MKAFITGGAGFIGSHLAERLAARGDEVTIYDNLSTGKKEYMPSNTRNIFFIEGDIIDTDKLSEAMRNKDIVFHLAAKPSVNQSEGSHTYIEQNIIGTESVLLAMKRANVKNIAFASTQVVYGEHSGPVSESSRTMPISYYGMSKLAGEALISSYCHDGYMRAWIFRLANIVGRRGHGVLRDFIKKLRERNDTFEILGNGNQRKSYLLVDECIAAMLLILEKSSNPVNIFNVGSADTIDVKTIVNIVTSELGLKPKLLFTGARQGWPGDLVELTLDTKKINDLGWHSKYTQEETISTALRQMLKD